MNAVEHFPLLAPLLAHKRVTITAPWSTCELKLTEVMYEELLRQTQGLPRFRFDRFLGEQARLHNVEGHRLSNRLLLGLVLTIVMAEYARREASEGSFWTVIARRFEPADYYTRLFTSVGQPTSLCREVLEQTARAFNLRHIYGQEGHKEWYSSVVLQFGFTRRGFERRLAEWLAGQTGTLSVRMLLEDRLLRSPSFHRVWEALWTYRKGNRTADQVRQVLADSPWVLPGWADALIRIARERRELDALPPAESFEDEGHQLETFLTDPKLIWEAPSAPYLKSSLVHLADFHLQAPDYTVRVGESTVGRLLRQPDGSYHAENNGEIQLPFIAGYFQVEIVSSLGAITAIQEIEVSEPGAEVALYDATLGTRIIDADSARLVQNHCYVLLLSEDLEVSPKPVAECKGPSPGFKAVALPPYTSGVVRVSLEGEPLCEWSLIPRHIVDSSRLKLVWGSHMSEGQTGTACTRLHLPDGWELRRARKDFRTIEFTTADHRVVQSESFPITPDDHVRDVRIELHLRFQGQPVRKNFRLSLPGKRVLWQRRGQQDFIAFDKLKPLYTHSAQHDRFLFRLSVPAEMTSPRDVALYYREHVVMEGAFFHCRLGQKPTTLPQLHGFGQRLVIRQNGFNTNDSVIEVAEAVFDTGLVTHLRRKEGEPTTLELCQPIYPSPEHQILIVASDLTISVHPCEIVDGANNNVRLGMPADESFGSNVAIGLFFRGVRLGSIWHHNETGRLSSAAATGAETALRVARLMRIFKFPLLSQSYSAFSRELALDNLPAFVTAWLDELPVKFETVELKSPGLDEAAAYAFAELVRLDPLDLNDDHAATLVKTYGGNDPLADPVTALLKTTVELGRLSPLLAADIAKRWLAIHAPDLGRGIGVHTVLPALRERLLGGLSEAQLVDQVSKATQTDEHFIQCHLQRRQIPNWKSNVRSLQHLMPFRVLLTRAFLNNL